MKIFVMTVRLLAFDTHICTSVFVMSEIEEKVIDIIRLRARRGFDKYNTTMERSDLSFSQWLNHLQEELLDASIYVEKLKSIVDEVISDGKR